ncbi:ABC transporter substrate-binding protein [Glycomyces sp. A-F 0318]|uniref:ABC transporter substrate-binding protein n=1 Tax=Glycomyces amatae TaxID=2881355 RepID=UPI001E506811|nr:ABC transporter substrate-binding protein [Glycomyces amatae]MCD0444016.1 ABC transporter substrate-binding protein [Glycomyces amatae]
MRSPRPALTLLTAALAGGALALAGCSSGAEDAAADGETRTVETEQGPVEVPADPQRVVVLNYALAGYLYDLEVPVVATIPEDADAGGEFSEFWADQAEEDGTEFLPWSVDGFDLEAVLDQEPDLIVAGGLGLPGAQAVEAYEQLSEIASTVIVSGALATWQDQFSFLAVDVFDKADAYEGFTADYAARAAETAAAITVPPGPFAVLSVTGDGTVYVLMDDAGLPQALAELGFEPAPLAAEHGFEPYREGGDMFELSTEQVAQVLTVPTVFVTGFNADTTDVATLMESDVFAALPAFADGNAHDLPYWSVRGDYDEALAVLDLLEQQFAA